MPLDRFLSEKCQRRLKRLAAYTVLAASRFDSLMIGGLHTKCRGTCRRDEGCENYGSSAWGKLCCSLAPARPAVVLRDTPYRFQIIVGH